MRRVLDTNIVVSGLIWGGVPKELLLLADDPRAELFTSLQLLDELTDVISRPKLIRVASNQNRYWPLLDAYRSALKEVVVGPIQRVVPSDPDDDVVVATALVAGADVIATGDRGLLDLDPYRGIRILNARAALRFVRTALAEASGR